MAELSDFSLVKKAPVALEAKGEPALKFNVKGSKQVLSECEGSRSLAGSGRALNP
jgi:hypothetical protein